MTSLGLLHLGSMLYLSGVICMAVSVNENHHPGDIVRETLRRWIKFLGFTFVIGLAVFLLSW